MLAPPGWCNQRSVIAIGGVIEPPRRRLSGRRRSADLTLEFQPFGRKFVDPGKNGNEWKTDDADPYHHRRQPLGQVQQGGDGGRHFDDHPTERQVSQAHLYYVAALQFGKERHVDYQ